MKQFLGSLIASHAKKRRTLSGRMVRMAELYVENFYQLGGMEENGEFGLIRKLSRCSPKIIFDVGANKGEYAQYAASTMPAATVHAFEPVPEVYKKLTNTSDAYANIVAQNLALSDSHGSAKINYFPEQSGSTSLISDIPIHSVESKKIDINMTTGTQYCEDNGIGYVDFLKCDVEGAEERVLSGFSELFRDGRIGAVQFEYGIANIYSRFLLYDAFTFFESHDFAVGLLGPSGIHFTHYRPTMENFKGPNFVAVHRSRSGLRKLVAA